MTREGQIRQASIEYTMENAPKCIGGDAFSEVMDGINRNHAFEEGAKWADANPKSPWISTKEDLPCNHKELISPDDKRDTKYVVAQIHGYIVMSRMRKMDGKWNWENDEPTYWMAIPEPPKE